MKTLIGKVISTKMDKTVVVEVERQKEHRLYKKIIRRSKKYKVHIEGVKVKVGDVVKISETKPISRHKHFKVLEKV